MTSPTQPLREEHEHLRPHIEQLRTAAEAAGTERSGAVRSEARESYTFLSRHLIPHAAAEEEALYPVVGRVLGAPHATATMSRDHVEIGALTQELGELLGRIGDGPLDQSQTDDLQRVLYGLYTLVRLHLAKEEEVYLPLLDAALSPDDARHLFDAMGHAAVEAKHEHAAT